MTSAMGNAQQLLLLGVGQVGRAVARIAPAEWHRMGTTRSRHKAHWLEQLGIEPEDWDSLPDNRLEVLSENAFVLVSYPPDGRTDAVVSRLCFAARKIVYISSTGVYGDYRGPVDDTTPVARDDPRAQPRLDAESAWRAIGAIVLRTPGIYGPEGGLHTRIMDGSYRIPGDGSNVISRIHVDDLARIVVAAFERGKRGETYVIGDRAAVPQIEVIRWLCDRLKLPLPGFSPIDQVPPTLRGSRMVNPARALDDLGIDLQYPTYREGFGALLS